MAVEPPMITGRRGNSLLDELWVGGNSMVICGTLHFSPRIMLTQSTTFLPQKLILKLEFQGTRKDYASHRLDRLGPPVSQVPLRPERHSKNYWRMKSRFANSLRSMLDLRQGHCTVSPTTRPAHRTLSNSIFSAPMATQRAEATSHCSGKHSKARV